MALPAGLDPYDSALVAAAYDREYRDLDADVAWFAHHGRRGRLLVLGCGTGRVASALAADREVVGLDRSVPMIERARRRSAAAGWVVGDMTDFDLGTFAEVIIPNASFAFLPDRRARAACLACCHAALEPGGELVLDLPLPVPEAWARRHDPEGPAWRGEVDGNEVTRTRETWRRHELQQLELIDRYYVVGDLRAVSPLVLHMASPDEVAWMLEACGFWVDRVAGDYADRPLGADSPRLLVRAGR